MGPDYDLSRLIAQLRDDLAFRRMRRGAETIGAGLPLLRGLDPSQRDAGVLLGLIAQWVDAGIAGPGLVKDTLDRFPSSCRGAFTLADYLHIRMAQGMLAMATEEFDEAIGHFRLVQSLETEVADPELFAIANFWIGRCLRQEGRYDDALAYAVKGRTLALEQGYAPMAAVIQLLESWLAFQKGKLADAYRILQSAEHALAQTDDFVNRGNVQSSYGRIARRQGRYSEAIACFERAIGEYRCHDPLHPHLARSLVNMAFVRRSIALDAQKAMDRESAHRRAGLAGAAASRPSREGRARITELRAGARHELADALSIYRHHENHRGIGTVQVNLALVALDAGDLEEAENESAGAWRHGHEKRDAILVARARIVQCMVEYARIEEQVGDATEHPARALRYAADAVDAARQTQNRRLLARALVWHGLASTIQPAADLESARRSCDEALRLLQPHLAEFGWDDLQTLQSRLLHSGGVEPVLKAWSEGVVGGSSFQQITEEFARILIPRVWEREGRKISRVAEKLSISPKKVRRILRDCGAGPDKSRPAGANG